jgi:CHAT domain-containing protein/Tfp pilus assembly protein PilF
MLRIFFCIIVFTCLLLQVPAAIGQNQEDEYHYLPQERILIDAGQYDLVKSIFEEKLEKAKEENNTRKTAKYTKNLGDIFLRQGQYDLALTQFQKAQVIASQTEDKKLQRAILHNIGTTFAGKGEYTSAKEYYQKALNIAESINYDYGIISGYNNIGNLYFFESNYTESQKYLEMALEKANEMNKQEYIVSVTLNLANIYNFQSNFDRAKVMYQNVAEASKSYVDQTLYADALHSLATLEHKLGKFDEAIQHYQESRPVYEKMNNKKKLSQLYLNLGTSQLNSAFQKDIIEKINLRNEAYNNFIKARDIALEINAIDTGLNAHRHIQSITHAEIATCDDLIKEIDSFNQNIEELDQIMKSQGKDNITSELKDISDLRNFCKQDNINNILKQETGKIEEFIKIAEQMNLKDLAAGAYMDLANSYWRLDDADKAIVAMQKSITLSEEFNPTELWKSYYNMALTLQKSGKNQQAEEYYQKSINLVTDTATALRDKSDKESYIKTKKDLFKDYAELKKQRGNIDEAMQILDLGLMSEQADLFSNNKQLTMSANNNKKAKLFDKALQAKTRSAEAMNEISKESSKPETQQNQDKIITLKQQLQQARKEFQKVALKLQEEYPEMLKYVAVKPTNMRTLKRQMPEKSVLIQPVLYKDKAIIFIAPSGDTVSTYHEVPIQEKAILLHLVNFRKALNSIDEVALIQASSSLYDILIKPIESELLEYDTIVISPYENLRYIPFQALYDGDKFLIEKYSVVNITSSSALKIGNQVAGKTLQDAGFLAFGNATEDLPASEQEVKNIAENFKINKLYLRNAAQKGTFDDEIYNDYSIIHLATHGILNNDDPENSKLLFAGQNNNSLTISDIMAYDFSDKRLIVLSACDSNIGKAKGAEITALGTAFEMAAAPSVVASLWKVNDTSTSILMEEFYNQLKNGQSKAKALRNAQIKLIQTNKFKNPYYWAPFILIGEWL